MFEWRLIDMDWSPSRRQRQTEGIKIEFKWFNRFFDSNVNHLENAVMWIHGLWTQTDSFNYLLPLRFSSPSIQQNSQYDCLDTSKNFQELFREIFKCHHYCLSSKLSEQNDTFDDTEVKVLKVRFIYDVVFIQKELFALWVTESQYRSILFMIHDFDKLKWKINLRRWRKLWRTSEKWCFASRC